MKFSIVIPALNEAESIGAAISALLRQNIKRSDFEIVVIDGKSEDGTAEISRKAGADIVISQKTEGTNFARQLGVEKSHGDIVVFLDADSEPNSDWLERIETNLNKPGVAAVSGPYDYGFKGVSRCVDYAFTVWLLPHVGEIMRAVFGRKAGVIIGGNFAAWRTAITKIGGLPPLKFWGDDAAAAMLFSRRVGRVIFDPTVIVKSSPRRFDKEGMLTLEIKYIKAYFSVYFSPDFQ